MREGLLSLMDRREAPGRATEDRKAELLHELTRNGNRQIELASFEFGDGKLSKQQPKRLVAHLRRTPFRGPRKTGPSEAFRPLAASLRDRGKPLTPFSFSYLSVGDTDTSLLIRQGGGRDFSVNQVNLSESRIKSRKVDYYYGKGRSSSSSSKRPRVIGK